MFNAVSIYAQIGMTLRSLINNSSFSSTKLIGFEGNWNDSSGYPVDLMDQAADAFDGVAFHCYDGSVDQQDEFYLKYPQKEIYDTECTGVNGADRWSDIKWSMDNLLIGSVQHNSHTALLWNLAGDPNGGLLLPGANSCQGGCLPIVTVYADSTYNLTQEFYSMAQASKAIIPKDSGGPWGLRIGGSVEGSLNWGIYVTGRVNSANLSRYSVVALNSDDNPGTPVQATIEFRGKQATYTFPVGVTTLSWYA